MKSIFTRFLSPLCLTVFVLILAFSTTSCSRKSGCPAENIQEKTDANGLPKANKPSSGLIPPKGYKPKRYKKKKHH